jgi:hypothetical protein
VSFEFRNPKDDPFFENKERNRIAMEEVNKLNFRRKNQKYPKPIKSVSGVLWTSKVVEIGKKRELMQTKERRKNLAQ